MEIGDGESQTITKPLKQGGLVAIYYLGTLIGALMCDLLLRLFFLKLTSLQGRCGI